MWLFGKEAACCVRGFKDQNVSHSCARAAQRSVLEALQQVPPCSASWGAGGGGTSRAAPSLVCRPDWNLGTFE